MDLVRDDVMREVNNLGSDFSRVVVVAALQRMKVPYDHWVRSTARGHLVEDLDDALWSFAASGAISPFFHDAEDLYPRPDETSELIAALAENFVEAFQLLGLAVTTNSVEHLARVLECAFNMADRCAGESVIPYNDGAFLSWLSPEIVARIESHPWVSRELMAQHYDFFLARKETSLDRLVHALRARATVAPVISIDEIFAIMKQQRVD